VDGERDGFVEDGEDLLLGARSRSLAALGMTCPFLCALCVLCVLCVLYLS
jgi:hypothetical protein